MGLNTLTILHRSLAAEQWSFACGHGETLMGSITDSAEEMAEAATTVLALHGLKNGCTCVPEAIVDDWPDGRLALAQYETDKDTPPANPEYNTPDALDHHRTTLAVLRTLTCARCVVHFRFQAAKGDAGVVQSLTALHTCGHAAATFDFNATATG